METVSSASSDAQRQEALVGRIRTAAVGAFETASIGIGFRLGLYEGLRDGGPQTAGELAARTTTAARPVREWLEQQAAGGILDLAEDAEDPDERRFALPASHATVLLDRNSDVYFGPTPIQVLAALRSLDMVLDSFRSGAGFPFGAAGDDMRISEGEGNRSAYLGQLAGEWLPSIPDVDARLRAAPPARIADVGCGYGWSSIGMALAYPDVLVDGIDLDEPSVEGARRNAQDSGVADRVTFQLANAASPALTGPYDLVTILEAFHDMSHPVRILATFRELLADGGSILIVDMRTNERFEPPSDERERYLYGWSVMECLHGGLQDGGPGTGTVMRPSTVSGYAEAAGLTRFEVLPIEHDSWRFYRLRA